MAASTRPIPRRGPSGAWSRLRTSPIDPLEAYGLPSKGDTRLSDAKVQEAYFETIVSRYMKFCATCGSGEKLEEAFASMSMNPSTAPNTSATLPPTSTLRTRDETARPSLSGTASSPTPIPQPQAHRQPPSSSSASWPSQNELPMLLMAMRKLREGIVSLKRTDAFAQRAYIFVVRTTLHPFRHYESYHPSLLYLLQKIHPKTPLAPAELQEFASYLILDLACRQGDLHEAFRVKRRYRVRDWKVERVLKSLVQDDWIAFWKVRRQVDGCMRVLLGWSEEGMRRHALGVLARAYMSADKAFVEKCADKEWTLLVKEDKVGWLLEGTGVVTIRKPKPRP